MCMCVYAYTCIVLLCPISGVALPGISLVVMVNTIHVDTGFLEFSLESLV